MRYRNRSISKESSLWVMLDTYMLIAAMGVTFGLVFMVMDLTLAIFLGNPPSKENYITGTIPRKNYDSYLIDLKKDTDQVVQEFTTAVSKAINRNQYPIMYYNESGLSGKEELYFFNSKSELLVIIRETSNSNDIISKISLYTADTGGTFYLKNSIGSYIVYFDIRRMVELCKKSQPALNIIL